VIQFSLCFFFSACLIIYTPLFSQVIDNKIVVNSTNKIDFNKSYITKHKIKRIHASVFHKKTGDIMRESGESYVYKFNDFGQPEILHEILKNGNRFDTIRNQFDYYGNGLLKVHHRFTGSSPKSTHYFYDSLQQVIKEEYYLDRFVQNFDNEFEFIADTLIDYETMRYKNYTNQQKKIIFNSYGNPYVDIISYFNKDGMISEVDRKLKMTSEIFETKYFYNPSNIVDSLVQYSNLQPQETESITMKYDSKNNILLKNHYFSNKLVYRTEFIYNEKTGMLSSTLEQEVATNVLTIVRFETFYE
jgi:hypothetical protein